MSAKPTPGPWSRHPFSHKEPIDVRDPDGSEWKTFDVTIGVGDMVIASAHMRTASGGWPCPKTVEECEANAALIMASPKLLAACELVLQSFGYAPGQGPEWYEAARLAVEAANEQPIVKLAAGYAVMFSENGEWFYAYHPNGGLSGASESGSIPKSSRWSAAEWMAERFENVRYAREE